MTDFGALLVAMAIGVVGILLVACFDVMAQAHCIGAGGVLVDRPGKFTVCEPCLLHPGRRECP